MANSMLVGNVPLVQREHSVLLELLRVPIARPIKSLLPVLVHAQLVLMDRVLHQ